MFIRRQQGIEASPDEPPVRAREESKPTGGKVPIRRDLIERGGSSEAWFGGGYPLPDLFTPTIRVPLRARLAEPKRANAKT